MHNDMEDRKSPRRMPKLCPGIVRVHLGWPTQRLPYQIWYQIKVYGSWITLSILNIPFGRLVVSAEPPTLIIGQKRRKNLTAVL